MTNPKHKAQYKTIYLFNTMLYDSPHRKHHQEHSPILKSCNPSHLPITPTVREHAAVEAQTKPTQRPVESKLLSDK